MASTVNKAFEEFLSDSVRLDPVDTQTARTSRDNLIDNINGFSKDDDFFDVYSDRNLKYGSFARRTKIRPIDDIDLMICISATSEGQARTYGEEYGSIYIEAVDFDKKNSLVTSGTNRLNSTKVINRFISKLSDLNDYSKAEMHKNHEAATLQLKSYTWNFDIVPCFYTTSDFYLIPDGEGNWKKTDPRIDNDRTSSLNQKHKGYLLDIIRLMKYWNNRAIAKTIGSYLLECMILSVYDDKAEKDNYWVDLEFKDLLKSLSTKILSSVYDPKGYQGDLNDLSFEDRVKISNALDEAYDKAVEASELERTSQKAAINKWREVFGSEFPEYSD